MKTTTIYLNSELLLLPESRKLARDIADAINTAYPGMAPNEEAYDAIVREISESGATLFSITHKESDHGVAFTVTLYGWHVSRPTEIFPVARLQLVHTAD